MVAGSSEEGFNGASENSLLTLKMNSPTVSFRRRTPYTVIPEGIPWLESYPKNDAEPTQKKAHFGYLVDIMELDFTTRVELLHTVDTGSLEYKQLLALGHECTYSDGTNLRAGILQNSIDTKTELIELCRIVDPALAKAEGW